MFQILSINYTSILINFAKSNLYIEILTNINRLLPVVKLRLIIFECEIYIHLYINL